MGPGITHLVLVAGWDGEDGAAVHLPHEELGHAVRRGTRPGSAQGGRAVTSRAVTQQHPTRDRGTGPGPGRSGLQHWCRRGSAQLHGTWSWSLSWRSRAWPSTEQGPGDRACGLEQALGSLPRAGGIAGESGRSCLPSPWGLPVGSPRSPEQWGCVGLRVGEGMG